MTAILIWLAAGFLVGTPIILAGIYSRLGDILYVLGRVAKALEDAD